MATACADAVPGLPLAQREKNAADAEAICESTQRLTMRFVPVKSEATQWAAIVLRIRDLLIRQRKQAINAFRGHLDEFGQIVPQGSANAGRLIAIVEDPDSDLPADAIATADDCARRLERVAFRARADPQTDGLHACR